MGQRQKKTRKHSIQGAKVVSPFPTGGHKAAMNRQESMTNKKNN